MIRKFNNRFSLCARAVLGLSLALVALQATSDAAIVPGTYGYASMKLPSSGYHGPSGNSAVTVNLTVNSVNYGNHNVSSGGSFNWQNFNYVPDNVSTETDEYGALTFVGQNVSGYGYRILTFCLELTENISPGVTYGNLSNTSVTDDLKVQSLQLAPDSTGGLPVGDLGDVSAHLIEELWKSHFLEVMTETDAATQKVLAGAFQLAIWKIEYDGGAVGNRNLSSGNLKVVSGATSSTATTAQAWLNALTPTGTGLRAKLVGLSKTGFQDQVAEVLAVTNEVVIVPEPASLATWGVLGLLGLAYRRRRMAAA